jgi:hypothetical protein
MTDIGVVLSLFSALAVLAVGSILGAGLWARARNSSQDHPELAIEGVGADGNGGPHWLTLDDDRR